MNNLIWLGHRESELIGNEQLFTYSITSWGSNQGNNHSLNVVQNGQDIERNEKFDFYLQTLKKCITSSDDKIMCYAPQTAYRLIQLCPELKSNFICLNSSSLINTLNNKKHTRLWLNNKTPIVNYTTCFGIECSYDLFHRLYPDFKRFVIQKGIASGGEGTYVFTKENETEILSQLSENELYLITPFIESSVSVNIHISIQKDYIITFPGSLQIIDSANDQMLYRGADYIAYEQIDVQIKEEIEYEAKKIGKILQNIGYRGVCGFDFLITKDKVFFVEINPRFQASTALLNYSLRKHGLPTIQELELVAHNIPVKIKKYDEFNLSVPYSLYKYYSSAEGNIDCYRGRLSLLEKSPVIEQLFYDGFVEKYDKSGTYLFSAFFSKNISSITMYNTMLLHPNIVEDNFISSFLPIDNSEEKLIKLKIALINQGMRIDDSAKIHIRTYGSYNESTFGSMDLLINNIRINVPINSIMCSLSPFLLISEHNTLYLRYYNETICSVKHESRKTIADNVTARGVPYHKIAFISGDRLRIKTENICYYKRTKQGCLFCHNIGNNSKIATPEILLEDIKEVFDYCLKNEKFRHIMIGGGSDDPNSKKDKILPVIQYIRSKCDKDIYVMSIPPNDKKQISEYIKAGVTEFAFNIEIMDRELASIIMPGKGRIPIEKYLKMLSYASSLLPKESVRSMLMLGLEPIQNTIEGIEMLCKNGIQPMLSIFRPDKTCDLHYMIPISNAEIYEIYKEAKAICQKYNMSLGPTCPSCQNNTLAITLLN